VDVTGSTDLNAVTGAGYWQEDVSMNSIVKYLGDDNDRAPIYANLQALVNPCFLNSTYTSVVPGAVSGAKSALAGGFVDARLTETSDKLSVNLLTNQALLNGVADNIQFTLAWNAGDTEIGNLLNSFESSFNLQPQGNTLEQNGLMYRVFATVTPTSLPSVWNTAESVNVLNFAKQPGLTVASRLWIAGDGFTSGENGDYFISNLGSDITGSILGTTTGIIDPLSGNSARIYPNPVPNGSFYLQLTSGSSESLDVRILDITGRLLRTSVLEAIPGTSTYRMDVSGFKPGVYVISIPSGNFNYNERFVIN